jgi:hypothetical protein
MKRIWILVVSVTILSCSTFVAEQIKTFSQAQKLSTQTGKPILLEFVHED